jgi:hypothetical protein
VSDPNLLYLANKICLSSLLTGICVKFHKNPISSLGGVVLTRYMDGRTDGQTDGRTGFVNTI